MTIWLALVVFQFAVSVDLVIGMLASWNMQE
jgi:hypothetical protein